MPAEPGPRPLDDVRVLDLSRVLAGPHCATLLGDLGADVVKVEVPTGGDEAREWAPRRGDGSAAFASVNRNKRGLTLDLKRPAGREVLRELLADTDVLVENFRPGTLEGWGLPYPDLLAEHPRLVYCRISAYGNDGPLATQPGYEAVMQAFSGIMSITGGDDGQPARCGASFLDMGTGVFAAYGVLAALRQRERTGRGQYLEASLLGTAVALLGYHAEGYLMDGVVPQPRGTSHAFLVPYRAYLCGDGRRVFVAAGNQGLWERFCTAFAADELREDPRFATLDDRQKHREAVDGAVEALLADSSSGDVISRLSAVGVPVTLVQDVGEVMRHEQTAGFVSWTDTEGRPRDNGTLDSVLQAPTMGLEIRQDAPGLGAHTTEILREAGIDDERIARLLRDQVVSAPS